MTTHRFHIQTFGCQMNAGDSAWLTRSLVERGFSEAPFEEASLYILNTCSIREKAEQKIYSELGRIARRCKVSGRSGVTVAVGGCVAQQEGAKIMRRFPQVRLLFGTDGIAEAPRALERLMEEPRLRLQLLDFTQGYQERDEPDLHGGAPASAFVNIMQGCDNYCAYCIVPYVRGRQKSRLPEHILRECGRLAANGAREITLLGQNVNAYGLDAGASGVSFADLLRRTAAVPGVERLRFVTSHPKDIAPEVIAAFGDMEALCPRLHLPLQSGSDKILQRMGRRYDTARYYAIVEALRKARPDILLTTDIITGFPGETDEDFEATMTMVRRIGFAAGFSFVYSDRPPASACLFPDKVERRVALERLSRLQAWQHQANYEILTSMVGKKISILLEGPSRRPPVFDESADKDTVGDREDALGDAYVSQTGPTGPTGTDDADAGAGLVYMQGKTPHGLIVNVALPGDGSESYLRGGLRGAVLPVIIEAAYMHSLKGKQAGVPW